MKPSEVFLQHRDTMRALVISSGMTNPRVFGSVLHGDDVDGSDIDLLVDPSANTGLFDLAGLRIELEAATNFRVDLLTPNSLPPKFRALVLAEAVPL